MESMTAMAGGSPRSVANIGHIGFRGEQHVGIIKPEALGAQPHLGDGLSPET